MERMEVYLAPSPRHVAQWWLAAGVAFALAAYCSSALYWQYGELVQREKELAQLHRLRHVSPPAAPSRSDLDIRKRWEDLQRELDFSWYPIFAALENASSQQIALLEFVPDKAANRMILRGNAKNIEELSVYLDALGAQEGFRDVHLAHQKAVQQTGGAAIFFEIRMRILE